MTATNDHGEHSPRLVWHAGRVVTSPPRFWPWVVLLGLVGQIAWAVENMYLNVYVYDTITDSPAVLATLVATSAVAATLATLLAGAASDRRGRRRPFVAGGYILWGLSTAAFGWVGTDTIGSLGTAAQAVTIAVVAIIALDCVMSALGATANDAAFQAWVTDSTTEANRGRVDGVLMTMPLLAMLVVFGALDPLTRAGQWRTFFAVVGGLTALVGVLALVGMRESPRPTPSGGYLSSVVHGLRPSTVRETPRLYLTLLAWLVVATSTQVFLPFLIIYVQRFLRIEGYALVLAVVLIGAAAVSVLGGRVLDRVGAQRGVLPAVAIYVVGLLLMVPARGMLAVMAAGVVTMGGMLLATAGLSATVRNLTPTDRAGQVQGLRMIFVVLVPMIVGPFVGAAVIAGADETYVDLGVVRQVPSPWIFLAAAVVALLVVAPMAALRRQTP